MFVGQAEITGFVVSTPHGLLTLTVKEQMPTFPFKSVARYVTVEIPIGKHLPGCAVAKVDTAPHSSVALGTVHCAAAQVVVVVEIEIFAGQVAKTGLVVSVAHGLLTITEKAQVALLFIESVAV
jgi:hypothetical protein